MGELTGVKVLGGLSTSVSVSAPVAISRPGEALATPPAPTTEPVVVPEMMAASLTPLMSIVKARLAESVPSDTVIVKFSVVGACSALIAALLGTKV